MEIHDFSQLTLLNKWNAVTSSGGLTPTGAAAIQAEKMKAALTTSASSAASETSAIAPVSGTSSLASAGAVQGTGQTVTAAEQTAGISGITDSAERIRQMTSNEASLQGAESTDASDTLKTTDSSFTQLLTQVLKGSASAGTTNEEYSELEQQLGRSVLSQIEAGTSSGGGTSSASGSSLSKLSTDLLGTSGGRKVMNAMIDGQLSATAMTGQDTDENDSSDTDINGNGFNSLI